MRNGILCLALLLFASFAADMSATTNSRADGAFKKIQSLAGDWEGKDEHGMTAKTSFKVIVKNTTVMETLSMSGMPTVGATSTTMRHLAPSCSATMTRGSTRRRPGLLTKSTSWA